jgi:hypothetical protein
LWARAIGRGMYGFWGAFWSGTAVRAGVGGKFVGRGAMGWGADLGWRGGFRWDLGGIAVWCGVRWWMLRCVNVYLGYVSVYVSSYVPAVLGVFRVRPER